MKLNQVTKETEDLISYLVMLSATLATLAVWTFQGTDPVNLPKAVITCTLSFAGFLILIYFTPQKLTQIPKGLLYISILFQATGLISVFFSEAPFSQTFYGIYGRQTGYLTYLVLNLLLILSVTLTTEKHIKLILKGLLFAGIINIFYNAWVIAFGDFIAWNNIYGAILGTLGNPNFISSFLGFFNGVLFAIIFAKNINLKIKSLSLLLLLISLYEIHKSNSIQGLVVSAVVLFVSVFFFIKNYFKNIFYNVVVLFFGVVAGVVAVFGALNHGPLRFIYKPSVSLRGTYWEVGSKIGIHHPFTGVGFDTYGDWYRAYRPERALVDTPPITVITNTAHNVFLDLFASGGFPLLLLYIGILFYGFRAIFKLSFSKEYNSPLTVAIAAIWIGYVSQSIISINQIGIAVWGWISTGCLVAIQKIEFGADILSSQSTKVENRKSPKNVKNSLNVGINREKFLSPKLIALIGALVGFFISYPPMNADNNWRTAVERANLNLVKESLNQKYFNPVTSQRYVQSYQMFTNSSLFDEQITYARIAVKFNRNNFESWNALYLAQHSTAKEKEMALLNMRRLDPLNPNLKIAK